MYKQVLINAKLQIGKGGKKTELTGVSSLRRQRFALDCSVLKEEEEDDISHIHSIVHRLVLPSIKTLSSNFLSVFVSDTQLRTICIKSWLMLVHNVCKSTFRKEATKCCSFLFTNKMGHKMY